METKTLKQFKQEFDNITKIKCFEIPVINKRTKESTYIVFDIQIIGRSFVAQHEALSLKQDKSKKIAFVKILIDRFFLLDNNLQELYSECINAIIESEYYELSD